MHFIDRLNTNKYIGYLVSYFMIIYNASTDGGNGLVPIEQIDIYRTGAHN